jgi:hypothetical protein
VRTGRYISLEKLGLWVFLAASVWLWASLGYFLQHVIHPGLSASGYLLGWPSLRIRSDLTAAGVYFCVPFHVLSLIRAVPSSVTSFEPCCIVELNVFCNVMGGGLPFLDLLFFLVPWCLLSSHVN